MSRLLGRNSLKYLSKLAFILPALVYLIFTQAYPLLNALFTSFTDKTIGVQGKFIGLENYIELAKDPIFWLTFRNSFVFTFGAVGLKLLFGMVMALVLNQDLILKNLWRALLFLPWTAQLVGYLIRFCYAPD